MLAAAYELEGLLLLAENRGDETSELIYTAIQEKVDLLRRLVGHKMSVLEHHECGDEAIGVTGLGLMEAVSLAEPLAFGGEEPLSCFGKEEAQESAPANEDELEELSLLMAGETSDSAASEADDAAEATEAPEADAEDTAEPFGGTVEDTAEAEESAEEAEPEAAESLDDTLGEAEEAEEDTGCGYGEAVAGEAADGEPDGEPLRLDEVLSRHRSKDLRAAFSLNDMFRFRRELFANNAADMTDAIHLVEAMCSFEEAEDYFYNDLEWDKESEEVREFMAVIQKHFL